MGDCGLDNYVKMNGQAYQTGQNEYFYPSSNSIYLNLTQLFQSSPQLTKASYEKDEKIRAVTLNTRYKVLTLLFMSNVTELTINVNIVLTIDKKVTEVSLKLIVSGEYRETKPIAHQTEKTNVIRSKVEEDLIESIAIPTIADDEVEPKRLLDIAPLFNRNSSLFNVLKSDGALELNRSQGAEQLTDKGLLLERYWQVLSRNESDFQTQGVFPWERDGTFEELARMIGSFEKYQGSQVKGHIGGRHLLDMFSDSLKYVNHLYNQVFGVKARKVVAHSPILLDIEVINRLWNRFPDELLKTSSHKLRSSDDMQYSFAYFNFLVSETVSSDYHQILSRFDSDRSG